MNSISSTKFPEQTPPAKKSYALLILFLLTVIGLGTSLFFNILLDYNYNVVEKDLNELKTAKDEWEIKENNYAKQITTLQEQVGIQGEIDSLKTKRDNLTTEVGELESRKTALSNAIADINNSADVTIDAFPQRLKRMLRLIDVKKTDVLESIIKDATERLNELKPPLKNGVEATPPHSGIPSQQEPNRSSLT